MDLTSGNYETQHLYGATALKAGEAITKLQAVCIRADGLVYLADADLATSRPCVGLAQNPAEIGEYVDIADVGWVDGESNLTPGDFIYLHTTAGGVSQTKNTYAQCLGIAVTTKRWKLRVDWSYCGGHYA
jgi:hypothetical protein